MNNLGNEKQIRKCIITNQSFNKVDMIRIVSFRQGNIEIDLSGKKAGRGCYVSVDINNLEKLIEKNGALLARVFRKKISNEEIDYLKKEFPIAVEQKQFRPKISKPITLRINKEDLDKIKNK